MTTWTWEHVLLSYLFIKRSGATIAELRRAFPEGRGLERSVEQLIERKSLSRQGKTVRLTDEGRSFVPEAVARRKLKLADLTQKLLPALAVGLDEPLTQAEIEAALIARIAGQPSMPAPKARQRLLWLQLGVDSAQPFTLGNVQKVLLARALKVETLRSPRAGFKALVAREAGVTGPLRASLRRKFLAGLSQGAESGISPPSFAQRALFAAATATRRFGRDLVYVSDAHVGFADPAVGLDEFKARLLDAHREGVLRLRRADLAAAMDPDLLRASEIVGPSGVTYHFIQVEGEPS
jgi:hypothetical protein